MFNLIRKCIVVTILIFIGNSFSSEAILKSNKDLMKEALSCQNYSIRLTTLMYNNSTVNLDRASRLDMIGFKKKLNKEESEKLQVKTNLIRLSVDTIIKMIAHHPELSDGMLSLFKDTHLILKNATKIEVKDEFNLIYFNIGDKNYKATVKATQNKLELYLTTIYLISDKKLKESG